MKLGNPNWAARLRRAGKGGVALCEAVSANAEEFALDLAAVVADMSAAGLTSLRAIAMQLTARGIRTRRSGVWQVSNMHKLSARLGRGVVAGSHESEQIRRVGDANRRQGPNSFHLSEAQSF